MGETETRQRLRARWTRLGALGLTVRAVLPPHTEDPDDPECYSGMAARLRVAGA